MSYGNYPTSVEIGSLGPTLIVGQKEDRKDESNGVGKTTITTAIVWCLFGRTPRRAAPGDNVINWDTKSECYVKITTADGWIITRTRKVNGHDDLLVHKDGEDVTLSTNRNGQKLLKALFNLDYDIFVSSMFFGQRTEAFLDMSDMKRKAALERLLGLNRLNVWGDVAKERKASAELEQQKIRALAESRNGDVQRVKDQIKSAEQRKATFEIERIAKTKVIGESITVVQSSLPDIKSFDINVLENEYNEYRSKHKKLEDLKTQLSQAKILRNSMNDEITRTNNLIENQFTRYNSIADCDINKLKDEHDRASSDEHKKSELQEQINKLSLDKRKIEQDIQSLTSAVDGWNNKADTSCPACKQLVAKSHTDNICKPYTDKLATLLADLANLNTKIASMAKEFNNIKIQRPSRTVESAQRDHKEKEQITNTISELKSHIAAKQAQCFKFDIIIPRVESNITTLEDALGISDIESRLGQAKHSLTQHGQLLLEINNLTVRLDEERNKLNPHDEMINIMSVELEHIQKEFSVYLAKISELDVSIRQLDYIKRSYHDRNKIKMFILSGLIPYLNQRIEYYLNAFECDLTLKFTPTLSIETMRWAYDFHSGGQQKRIDLAIMFALYDLYISMYGQQCNVMVLDEVDGALDPHGVRMFVDIINNDFAGDRPDKPDTILIISHKNDMVDQFPGQIIVSQDSDGFSHILKA